MNDPFNLNSARSVAETLYNLENSPERVQAKALKEIEKNTK